MKIGHAIREPTDERLRFVKQLGCEGVFCPAQTQPDVCSPATAEQLGKLRETVESHGLEILTIQIHPRCTAEILKGAPGRDQEIEGICQTIRAAGEVGIPTMFFELTHWRTLPTPWPETPGAPKPGGRVLRIGSGPGRYYRAVGRGGAVLLTHDSARATQDAATVSAESNAPYGAISAQDMWDRIRYFYERVTPVADEAGVNVGTHPNDPPEKFYRGAEQVLNTVEGLKKLTELVLSPRNGLLLCLGTLHEMCHSVQETMKAIEYFLKKGKIFSAHFRNPRGGVPHGYYQEDFLDEGDLDMLAVMRLFHQYDYAGSLNPDHAVGIVGDDPRGRIAFAWEIGYMKALRAAVEAGY